MAINNKHNTTVVVNAASHLHEWEVFAGFALTVSEERLGQEECILEPIAFALKPFGIVDTLLCEMSTAVNQAGEELHRDCPDGSLDCVTVRGLVSSQTLRESATGQQNWRFFINKQLASSESDNLAGPCATIDLHVYQEG